VRRGILELAWRHVYPLRTLRWDSSEWNGLPGKEKFDEKHSLRVIASFTLSQERKFSPNPSLLVSRFLINSIFSKSNYLMGKM
jgi:hypothetical protein